MRNRYSTLAASVGRAASFRASWPLVVLLTAALGGRAAAQPPEVEVLADLDQPIYALAFSRASCLLAWPTSDGISLHRLAAAPTVPTPRETFDERRIVALIQEMDANQFERRQQAFKQLAEIGSEAEPSLRTALAESNSREVRARIEWLLAELAPSPHEPHRGPVLSLAFAADAQTVVSGGKDGTVRCWSAAEGHVIRILRGHRAAVWSVDCSPVEDLIASGGGDHEVRLWPRRSRRLGAVLRGHDGAVHDVRFSPDGRWLASAGSFDKAVLIWDVAQGSLVVRLATRQPSLRLCWSADSRQLAAAGYEGAVQIFELPAGNLLTELSTSSATIRALWFDPAQDRLICGDQRGATRIWRLSDGHLVRSFSDHVQSVRALQVLADGRVATAGLDGRVLTRRFGGMESPALRSDGVR